MGQKKTFVDVTLGCLRHFIEKNIDLFWQELHNRETFLKLFAPFPSRQNLQTSLSCDPKDESLVADSLTPQCVKLSSKLLNEL